MKKALLTIISICLIAACVFGLVAGVQGFSDALNVANYKTEDAEEGLDTIDNTLLPGIEQLMENEDTYTNGVSTYEAGLITYQQGQVALAEGGQQLAENYPKLVEGQASYDEGVAQLAAAKKQLEEGQAAYDAGVAQLEAGKQAYAEGQATIEANTDAYNEGKATLAKIEPLMPYVNQYVSWRDGTIANLPGFSTAQAWFVAVVRPIASQMGVTLPSDVTDFPAYIQNMVAEGQAQLKAYEDGVAQLAEAEQTIAEGEATLAAAKEQLDAGYAAYAEGEAQLAEGKATLDAGYAAYAEGEQDYADGKAQLEQGAQDLADGKAQLAEFEDGAAQVAAGMETLLALPEYRNDEGEGDTVVCPSVRTICEERLGEDFSYWELDDNGEILVLNDCQYLNLENCKAIAQAARDYIAEYQTDAVTSEVYGRVATYACLLLASVAGILAGLFGLLSVGKISGGKIGTAVVCGYISAVAAIAGNVVGLFTGYTGYAFPCEVVNGDTTEYVYTGHTQVAALITLAVVAVLFVIVASIVRHAYKASKAAVAAEAAAAATVAEVPATTPVVDAVEAPAETIDEAPADVDTDAPEA